MDDIAAKDDNDDDELALKHPNHVSLTLDINSALSHM